MSTCFIIHSRKFDIQATSGYDDMLISFECTICISNIFFIICVIWEINMIRNSFDLQNALIEMKSKIRE